MVRSIQGLGIALALTLIGAVGCAVQPAGSDEVTADTNTQSMKVDGQKPMVQAVWNPCVAQPQPWDGNPCSPSNPSGSSAQAGSAGGNVNPNPTTTPTTLIGQKTPLTPIPTH